MGDLSQQDFVTIGFRGRAIVRNGKPADPENGPLLQVIFDPLEGRALHRDVATRIRTEGHQVNFVPVHLVPGSLPYGERFLGCKGFAKPRPDRGKPKSFFLGLKEAEYLDYLDTGFHIDLQMGRIPQLTSYVLSNTFGYRLLFKPKEQPPTPYMLWKVGLFVAGQPAYMAMDGSDSVPKILGKDDTPIPPPGRKDWH
jgi:hypothetical protein